MGESIRELGLEGQTEKAGTPTMGGGHYYSGNPGACITLCQVGQYLCDFIDRNHTLDGDYRFYR